MTLPPFRRVSFMSRRMPWSSTLVLCAGSVAIVWFVSAVFDTRGPDRVIGPYHVPLAAETLLGTCAVLASCMVIVGLARHQRRSNGGASFGAAGMLIFTSVFATVAWRVSTAMGEGADLGGGFFVLIAPLVIAALLFGAVCVHPANGGVRSWYAMAMWCTLAWLTGPVLFTINFNLGPN